MSKVSKVNLGFYNFATAEVVKDRNKKSKENKVWPAQAVKIESVVNCAAEHKGMKSTSRPSSRPSTVTGSADSNPHALRSADRREEVVANGVADDDEWAPSERPDEIATAEVDKAKDKSIKKDIPFALHRGTIGQVTTALDAAQRAAEDELALNEAGLAR